MRGDEAGRYRDDRREFADAVRDRVQGYGLAPALPDPDLTPPWVADEVRAAQAFIDYEWSLHVHDTEHVRNPDWQVGPEFILYNSLGDVQVAHIECRYCRIAALTDSLKEWYDQQPEGLDQCRCGDC